MSSRPKTGYPLVIAMVFTPGAITYRNRYHRTAYGARMAQRRRGPWVRVLFEGFEDIDTQEVEEAPHAE